MKVTGRLQSRTVPQKGNKEAFLSTHSGEQIARQVQVETLRRLVANGRYTVDADGLAYEILRRTLSRRGRN